MRDIFQKKLHIRRDIAMSRVSRVYHGPEFRGHRPIQICLINYRYAMQYICTYRVTILEGKNLPLT